MSRYQFTLTPIDNFFFGNEVNMRPGIESNDRKKSYSIKSNLFPQQTSILGMLRKELLIKEGLFSEKWVYTSDKQKASLQKLIGASSFDLNNRQNIQDFGVIKGISPVCLQDKHTQDIYITCPLNHKQSKQNSFFHPWKMAETSIYTSLGAICLPQIGEYETKKGLFHGFLNCNDSSLMAEKDIFIEDERIGITKSLTGGAENEKYYKLMSYRLLQDREKEFAFYFEAELDSLNLTNYKNIVSLGMQGRGFFLEATQIVESKIPRNLTKNLQGGVVLLSDTYMEDTQLEDHAYGYAISESLPFRNIKTESGKMQRQENLTFLKRGSVLYAKDKDTLKKKIAEMQNLMQIGYNVILEEGVEK